MADTERDTPRNPSLAAQLAGQGSAQPEAARDLAQEGTADLAPEEGQVAIDVEAPTTNLDGSPLLLTPPEIQVPSRYKLRRLLGQGGFGAVYQAFDAKLGRQVALKFLLDSGPLEVARLRREARFTARLDDPAIVKVFELGEHEGTTFIVMQYVAGQNLARARISHRELALVLRTVAAALGRAHQAGIVHRDIKPENILLDGEGHPFLTDFGIARDLRGRGMGSTGFIIGTPELMPPEQARGDAARVDGRSDVYSLGATLYTLLAGRRPFAGRPSLFDTLMAVVREEPEPPSRLRGGVPPELEAIALRCMRKTPAARFASMAEVVQVLDCFLNGEELPLDPDPTRRPTAARRSPLAVHPAPLEIGLEVAGAIAHWDGERYRRRGAITARFPLLEELVERLNGVLQGRPALAWARFYRGMALRRLGGLEAALDDMERSIGRLSALPTAHRELGRTYLELGLQELREPSRPLGFVDPDDHLAVILGYLEEAQLALREAERREGRPLWLLGYARAATELALGDPLACLAACEALLSEDGARDELWRLVGDAEQRRGVDPRPAYRAAVRIRPGDYATQFALAEAELARGERTRARKALRAALAAHPAYVPALLTVARLLLEASGAQPGSPQAGALEHLARARDAAPLDGRDLPLEAARSQLEAGWVDQALEVLPRGGDPQTPLAQARAHLERAQHALAAGEDPRPDLDALLRRAHESRRPTASDHRWADILSAAWKRRGQS